MTTAKAYLNIKIDKHVKEIAAQLLENMGLDHTTAIDMFYRQMASADSFNFSATDRKNNR